MMQENWSATVEGLLSQAEKAAQNLQDFLAEVVAVVHTEVGRTPHAEDLISVIHDIITRLGLVKEYCREIKNALDKENWSEVIANFPTREWLGSLEDSLAALENNSFFRSVAPAYKGSLKKFFAQLIFDGFKQVANILENAGIKGVRERFSEHAPPEPMTERELEREYEARQPAEVDWEGLERHFNDLLGALKEALTEKAEKEEDEEEKKQKKKSEALKFIEGLKQDFETAKQKRKVDILRDIYRNLLNLQPHVPEDKMELYNTTLNYFRLYALPLKKFLILGKILGSGR